MRKNLVRTTPEQAEQMQRRREQGATVERVAQEFGVSVNSVVRHTKPPLFVSQPTIIATGVAGDIVTASVKRRILKLVADLGPFDDVATVQERLNGGEEAPRAGRHEVTHLLWSLNKEGLVSFSEDKRRGHLTRIRATARGFAECGMAAVHREVGSFKEGHRAHDLPTHHNGDRTDFRTHGSTAQGGPIERRVEPARQNEKPDNAALQRALDAQTGYDTGTRQWARTNEEPSAAAVPSPVPVPEAAPAVDPFPELSKLRRRFAENAEADANALKYLEAAELIRSIDPVRAEALEQRAVEVGGKPFTAAEREYLRYAEAHP